MHIVKFAYYDDFRCSGPDCTDNCCRYWHIDISKSEYLYYMEMKCSNALRSVIDGAFKRKKEPTDIRYAEMKLTVEGKCHFLGKDSLCMLQKELGEESLSLTCRVFPRLHMKVGKGTVMQSCSATCCRVTEILMEHPEGLRITEEEYDGEDRYINNDMFTLPRLTPECKELSFYWTVLNAQIDILQNRGFTVPERMLILGYFCQKTDEYIKKDEASKNALLAKMLLDSELCRKIVDSLSPNQSDKRIADSSIRILHKMFRTAQNSPSAFVTQSFGRIMGRLAISVGLTIGNNEPDIGYNAEEYIRLTGMFKGIMEARPYIIENLLVNLAFSQNIRDGVWNNYFAMAVFYNTLKLCVPVFLKDGYNDKELAAALTYAVKLVLNTNLAKSNILLDSILQKKDTLPYAVFLIC